MSRAKEETPVLHPRAGEDWFRKLAPEKQEELNAACRREAAHHEELLREERRRLGGSGLQVAALYLAIDVACPGRALSNACLAVIAGGLVGVLLERLCAGRVLSGSIGVAVFFLLQLLTRQGLSALHMFWFFPVAASAAILGLRRENGE